MVKKEDKIEEFEEFRSKLVDVLSKLERIEGAASPESLESALTPSELDFFYDRLSIFKAINALTQFIQGK